MKLLKRSIILSSLIAAGVLLQSASSFASNYAAKAYVTPQTHVGACPKKFNFRGVIAVRKAGRIQYKWIRSDNANSPVRTLHFTGPGKKGVSTSWTIGRSYNGWQAIKIIYPQNITSNKAMFKLRCQGKVPGVRKLPDLTVRLAAPRVAYAGQNIGPQLKVYARNIGNASAPGTDVARSNGYMIDMILSKDTTAPSGFATYSPNYSEDVLLRGGRISNTKTLVPGAIKRYATGGGIPANTPAGNYFVCAKVDSGEKIRERRENNNVACSRIKIKRRVIVRPTKPI